MIELASVRVDHPRGGAPLLLGADLTVGRGEILLVTGPAGAGGSRLIAALQTLRRMSAAVAGMLAAGREPVTES